MGNCCLSTGKYHFSDKEMALIVFAQARVRGWLAKRLLKRTKEIKI
jgi:citrate synthase